MPGPIQTTNEKPSTSEINAAQSAMTGSNQQSSATIKPSATKSEAELAAEKLYEERMEEEYAKREGGA